MDEKEYVELRGTVEQIVFSNEENGYAVLRLLSQEGAEITATGTFPGIGLGEELTMANSSPRSALSAASRQPFAASRTTSPPALFAASARVSAHASQKSSARTLSRSWRTNPNA